MARQKIEREAVTKEVAFQRAQADGHALQVQTLIDNVCTTAVAQQRAQRVFAIVSKCAADLASLESELAALDAEHVNA